MDSNRVRMGLLSTWQSKDSRNLKAESDVIMQDI